MDKEDAIRKLNDVCCTVSDDAAITSVLFRKMTVCSNGMVEEFPLAISLPSCLPAFFFFKTSNISNSYPPQSFESLITFALAPFGDVSLESAALGSKVLTSMCSADCPPPPPTPMLPLIPFDPLFNGLAALDPWNRPIFIETL